MINGFIMNAVITFNHTKSCFFPIDVTIDADVNDTLASLTSRATDQVVKEGRFSFSEFDGFHHTPKSIMIQGLTSD